MSGFVNNNLSNLVSILNSIVLSGRLNGRVVYSKFSLKILLFLVARGFLSDIQVVSKGPGGFIKFNFKTSGSGSPVINRIFMPSVKKSKVHRLACYSNVQSLSSVYSSEFVLVSTSKGLMTAPEAIALGLGGVVILVIL